MSPALEIAVKIGLAALLSGLIGAQRERTGKAAGLRTHMLMAVGAALLTHVSLLIGPRYAAGSSSWDPGRIASQIIPGVGFIGAGTILHSRGAVHGLTTAAGLWVASAIGMAVGAGFYVEASLTTLALLLILTVLVPVERLLRGDRHTVVLRSGPNQKVSRLLDILETSRVRTESISAARTPEGVSLQVKLRGSPEDVQRLVLLAGGEEFAAAEEEDAGSPPPDRGPFL
jgi:putative Mg2+ transporter-C (MgtC) family protein